MFADRFAPILMAAWCPMAKAPVIGLQRNLT
jgi:hypothetical protein